MPVVSEALASCRQIALATCLCMDSVTVVGGRLRGWPARLRVRRAVEAWPAKAPVPGWLPGRWCAPGCRCVRAGRRLVGDLALQGGVHADGEADRLAEALAEGVLDAGAQPALELVAGELVGYGDHGGALGEHQRLAGRQPDPLVRREAVHDPRPEDLELGLPGVAYLCSVLHPRPVALPFLGCAVAQTRSLRGSTPLSTGCAMFEGCPDLTSTDAGTCLFGPLCPHLSRPNTATALGIPVIGLCGQSMIGVARNPGR